MILLLNKTLDPAVKPRGVKGVSGFPSDIDAPRLDRGVQEYINNAKKISSSLKGIITHKYHLSRHFNDGLVCSINDSI